MGQEAEITWSASDSSFGATPIKFYYSFDGGATFSDSSSNEANDGTFTWIVPNQQGDQIKIAARAIDTFGYQSIDESDNVFTIHLGVWHVFHIRFR